MRLTVHVVAHVDRINDAADLAHDLAPATIHLDDGRLGTYANHRRALAAAAATDATHAVVLEDDALPIPGFLEHAHHAIARRPEHLIGLYVGTGHPRLVQSEIAETITTAGPFLTLPRQSTLRWGVGTIYPVADLVHVIATADRLSAIAADRRLGAWHGAQDRIVYTWPSLVDHADLAQVTPEHGRRLAPRRAWRVGAPEWAESTDATPGG